MQAEGNDGVEKAKQEEGNADKGKSLEYVRATGCSDQTKESKSDGRQLQDGQAGYLKNLDSSVRKTKLDIAYRLRGPLKVLDRFQGA